jgi:hypothetical protein
MVIVDFPINETILSHDFLSKNIHFQNGLRSHIVTEVKGKALGYEGRLTSGYFNNITEATARDDAISTLGGAPVRER